jgi:hypothetical protein
MHPYLNAFHRRHSESLEEQLAQQTEVSLEDALRQYDRIKRGSTRNLRFVSENTRLAGFSGHTPFTRIPDFPVPVADRLGSFSISTAEAFLSWQVTQAQGTAAEALAIDLETFTKAVCMARAVVSEEFLRELDEPRTDFSTGADV